MPILEIRNVSKTFRRNAVGEVAAVIDTSLSIERGETFGLIGASGSGKSTVARLALGLVKPDVGEVIIDGVCLGELNDGDMRRLRSRMSAVFQEPYESLDPRQCVGAIVGEPLVIHKPHLSRSDRQVKVVRTLESVGLTASYYRRFPAELSGGEQQRVGIARAIITEPKIIVLDEPTSSLDLSIRARILSLLIELQGEYDLTYLLISHDMNTIGFMSSKVAVMKAGSIVEHGTATAVLSDPREDYTRLLLESSLSL